MLPVLVFFSVLEAQPQGLVTQSPSTGTDSLQAVRGMAYAQLSSLVTQAPSSGMGSQVKLEKIDAMKNFKLSPEKDKLIVEQPGVYLAIASGQVAATTPGATGYVDCWFIKNGQPLPNSTVRLAVDTPTYTGLLISQYIMELAREDALGIMFTASGPSLGFVFIKPAVSPVIPSFILSITRLE